MSRCFLLIGVFLALYADFAPGLSAQAPAEERPEVIEAQISTAGEVVRDAKTLFGLGVMRHRGDRWLEAVKFLEEAAKLDPDTPAAYRALIPLYRSLAREDDALVCCRKVLERDPTDAATAFELSKLLKADGQLRDAIAALAQGAKSPRAEARPDLLYYMLNELAELQEKIADHRASAVSYRRLALHLITQRARLLGSDTLTEEQLALASARAYEKVGQCHLQEKQFDEATKAFREARDFLEQQRDPATKLKAVRLNWNLAQACIAREKWADASAYLDSYLEHRPADQDVYEKKVMVLRKLDRERDVLPFLKKYASLSPDVLGIQLLHAKELAGDPQSLAQAETRYLELAQRFPIADVYRGLFTAYQAGDRMIEVLNLIDKIFATIQSKDDIAADVRELARDRGRAILQVLKSEPGIVNSLLPVVLQELRGERRREIDTWRFLASMAARAKQFDKSEILFRQCVTHTAGKLDQTIYGGLLEVLWLQRKYDDVIKVCKEVLDNPGKADAAILILFHRNLALAYSEKDKVEDAIVEADKAIKLSTEAGKVLERCRKARILAMAERYDAAVAECESLLKDVTQAGDIKQVRYTISSVYTFMGDHEKSEAQLLKILEENPNDPGANNDLGYHWAERNCNLDEAEKMIRKAIEVDHIQRQDDPEGEHENAAYFDSLGWTLFRKGKTEEARDWLEKASALQMGSEDPTVWDHLGDVYLKLKQPIKAKEAWQTAIKLYDHDRRGKKEGRQEEAKRKLKMVME